MRVRSVIVIIGAITGAAHVAAQHQPFDREVPMEDVLAAISQISPLAREAADHYRDGFLARCGRPITSMELRRAFAAGRGEPVLMTMVTALARQDTLALNTLKGTVPCKWN